MRLATIGALSARLTKDATARPTAEIATPPRRSVTIAAGSWKRVDVRFADPSFRQTGKGAAIPWDPTDVTGVQIQSIDVNQTYDFWIDDVYLAR